MNRQTKFQLKLIQTRKSARHPIIFILILSVFLNAACSYQKTNAQHTNQNSTAINNKTRSQTESEKANRLFERFHNETVARHPVKQTYLGIKTNYDKWNDVSEPFLKETSKLYERQLNELTNLNSSVLDDDTFLSYRLMQLHLEQQLKKYRWRHYDYPVNQKFGAHTRAPAFLINQHLIQSKADAHAYLSRLRNLPRYFSQVIDGMRIRESKGIVPPRFVFPYAISTSRKIISGQPFSEGNDSAIYADFKKKVNTLALPEAEKTHLVETATAILIEDIQPAYHALIAYLKELEKKSDTRDGVWKFPDGKDFYEYALAKTTTTELSANEIHTIGLKDVDRIHKEMQHIIDTVNFDGDLHAFFAFMRDDTQFYYDDSDIGREQYLADVQDIINNMKDALPQAFLSTPKAKLRVKRVEAFREKSVGKAFYQRPSPDGSRPGTYYANLYRMKNMPRYQMEALAYHESVPGHHLQIAVAQELTNLPDFRKFGRYTAYTEGWGLYAEWLPKEMGFYKDPYSDFGRLAMELWRSCRLVVDTGIHSKRWTREQAIDYLKRNTPNAHSDIVRAVERYIVMPSQATAYKIGMITIQELRSKAERILGDDFDQREFHQAVLGSGAVPLTIMEEQIDQWLQSKLGLKLNKPKSL